MNEVQKLLLDGEIPVNCYVIKRDNECYIVDPGYQKQLIQQYIAQKGYQVKGILLTHGHIDHIEALDCFDVPVYLHKKEYEILMDNYKNGFDYFGKPRPFEFENLDIKLITEDTQLEVGKEIITVIFTPGHTIGSVCYKIGHDLYTGDTLFEGSVGKWDRPTGDVKQLKQSILRLINEQDDHILIHPGHGRSSAIGIEKQINPFYRKWYYEEVIL
ncbi:MBL fold metallo-hydrolase [Ancylomarina longa]|uniref:MBL fold metallo-hydrolase n=1 Tax=Ancylomarina longa TaxID=2487017 RepID=A0A434AWV9_9BACT|nr:MBL fold metallo-hydrolase [Ancylomarina longa]RUT78993.1 MBL fold metallo-hydrolase [Ancylomarina longa]